MAETKVKKLSYDEMFNSTTMFYINDSCEEAIKKIIDAQTADILVGLKTITSKETLKQYIIVTIHSQPKPVKWKTKEIIFCLKANQRLSGRCDLSGC